MSRTRRKVGGQPGNTNGVKHGGYAELARGKLDGRTTLAQSLDRIKADLTSSLGEPSVQELAIIELVSVKILRASLLAAELLKNGDASARVSQDFLRWSREIRSDLVALGLERKTKPVVDLAAYCAQKYGGDNEPDK